MEVDLKKTVNLPRTDFPMKANLPQLEPKLLERWDREGISTGEFARSRAGRPKYVLHDGPPYANGNIHLGHAFNKMLKDFIVKSKTMAGFDSPYVPGWDCHGLPIEIKVDQRARLEEGADDGRARSARACRKYAEKYVDLQQQGLHAARHLRPVGQAVSDDEPAVPVGDRGRVRRLSGQGYVYKGLKPVNWCINDRTALAEAEVEYENHTSPSIWVRFALTSDPAKIDPALAGRKVYGLIWTTTPWTIPANMAIAYHPEVRVRRRGGGRATCTSSPRDLLQATTRSCRLALGQACSPRSRARSSKAPCSGIRSSSAIRSASWPIT